MRFLTLRGTSGTAGTLWQCPLAGIGSRGQTPVNAPIMSGHLFRIRNDHAGLERVGAEVTGLLQSRGCAPDLIRDVNLGLEEVITNIVKYGYDDPGPHAIDVQLDLSPGLLRLTIADDGHEFDPLGQQVPDTTRRVEEREPGGLGIHMLRSLFDAVAYRREPHRNLLVLEKGLRPAAG